MSVLSELSDATRAVADQVGPSVVRIGSSGGRGCGVVVGEGQVATNAHNLRGRETTVTFADGRTATGELSGTDIDGDGGAPAVGWGDDAPALGDVVFAVVRGFGGASRVTWGTVSATERAFRGPRGRRITGSLEHTAPLTRGSSGSPVVDGEGRLVGLNTNRLGEGFYLALPADDDLRNRIEGLQRGDAPAARHLGVGLAPGHVARKLRRSVGLPDRDGLLVRVVEDGSPADQAGLHQGDLIVRAGDRDVARVDDLYDVLDAAEDHVDFRVVRGTDELDVRVSFDEGRATTEGSA
jgi:serine protease Do